MHMFDASTHLRIYAFTHCNLPTCQLVLCKKERKQEKETPIHHVKGSPPCLKKSCGWVVNHPSRGVVPKIFGTCPRSALWDWASTQNLSRGVNHTLSYNGWFPQSINVGRSSHRYHWSVKSSLVVLPPCFLLLTMMMTG